MDRSEFVLAPWRSQEIIKKAVFGLIEAGAIEEDFSVSKMLADKGIRLKAFSEFKKENLESLRKISVSFRNDGLCLNCPDDDNDGRCRMVAYDDSVREETHCFVILHEYGHIDLGHTQQSAVGEAEAICYATAAIVFLMLRKFFAALMSTNGFDIEKVEVFYKMLEDQIQGGADELKNLL